MLLLFLLIGASGFFFWFALLCLRIITYSKGIFPILIVNVFFEGSVAVEEYRV